MMDYEAFKESLIRGLEETYGGKAEIIPVYSTIKLPKKSVRIPHFQKGKFPIKSGTH